MQFNIEIIKVKSETKPTAKGSYTMLDVAFTNLSSGKVESKKIMSFANKTVFDILSKAESDQKFTVTSEKNEKTGYWDWVSIDTGAASSGSSTTKGFTSPKSTYETAEERAKRQVLIVRQSSLTAAITTLKDAKGSLNPDDVVSLAQDYVAWVFQEAPNPVGFEDMEDDVPV